MLRARARGADAPVSCPPRSNALKCTEPTVSSLSPCARAGSAGRRRGERERARARRARAAPARRRRHARGAASARASRCGRASACAAASSCPHCPGPGTGSSRPWCTGLRGGARRGARGVAVDEVGRPAARGSDAARCKKTARVRRTKVGQPAGEKVPDGRHAEDNGGAGCRVRSIMTQACYTCSTAAHTPARPSASRRVAKRRRKKARHFYVCA